LKLTNEPVGCYVDVTLKDVLTVRNELWRLREWVKIVNEISAEFSLENQEIKCYYRSGHNDSLWEGIHIMVNAEQKALMREYYLKALEQDTAQLAELSSTALSTNYPEEPEWCIGPFKKEEDMTFRKPGQWRDPLDIGWTGNFIFNCSLIEENGKLYMFYRTAPKKESLCSRIGLTVYSAETGWVDYDRNPVIYPTEENELLGCEDPKIYRVGGRYIMFYHGVYYPTAEQKRRYESKDFPVTIATDIKWAESNDLLHWEKRGLAVPLEVSRLWAKAAVVPGGPNGDPVKIDGEYLMFLSEGCGGKQAIGRSYDMVNWSFAEQKFLDITGLGYLYEVSCCVAGHKPGKSEMVLDFYYRSHDGNNAGAQALYDTAEPFAQKALNIGASLSWGGLIQYNGKWMFGQGWDAPPMTPEMYFYSAEVK